MTESLERPKFLPSYFAALSERAQGGTLWRMFIVPALAISASVGVAYLIPTTFWLNVNLEVSTTVYTGILTVNGLILALSWSAFSRIYESISAPKFCAFLRNNNLLNKYIITVSSIHGLQLLAVIASAIGLVSVLIDIAYIIVDQILFGIMIFFSIYAVQQAVSAVAIMNDLLWQKAIFDEHREGNGGSTVVQMGGRNDLGE